MIDQPNWRTYLQSVEFWISILMKKSSSSDFWQGKLTVKNSSKWDERNNVIPVIILRLFWWFEMFFFHSNVASISCDSLMQINPVVLKLLPTFNNYNLFPRIQLVEIFTSLGSNKCLNLFFCRNNCRALYIRSLSLTANGEWNFCQFWNECWNKNCFSIIKFGKIIVSVLNIEILLLQPQLE